MIKFSPKHWGVPFDPCFTKHSLENKKQKHPLTPKAKKTKQLIQPKLKKEKKGEKIGGSDISDFVDTNQEWRHTKASFDG